MTTILIAEDEVGIASFIEKGLQEHGYETTVARDGNFAYMLAKSGAFDLMILDIGLPGLDGFQVLKRLRAANITIPIIVLTARQSLDDTVAGLESGANDYMSKPFAFMELLARVKARLREGMASSAEETITRGDLTLDVRNRTITVGDNPPQELTAREFSLLDMMMRNVNLVLTRAQLQQEIWGDGPESNVVDVLVRAVRAKIGANHIQTVRGLGYKFEPIEPA